jgi:hypothetical protein
MFGDADRHRFSTNGWDSDTTGFDHGETGFQLFESVFKLPVRSSFDRNQRQSPIKFSLSCTMVWLKTTHSRLRYVHDASTRAFS